MDKRSKVGLPHQKTVLHKEILSDGRHGPEIESLQVSRLEDSSKGNLMSSGDLRVGHEESTSVQRKDDVTSPDDQKIADRSRVMIETSKLDLPHPKEKRYDRQHHSEIANLPKLKDALKGNIISTEELKTDQISSGKEFQKAHVMTGKIKNYNNRANLMLLKLRTMIMCVNVMYKSFTIKTNA